MLFTSSAFLLGFLPIAIAGYWILNFYKKFTLSLWWLLLASVVFYGWMDWRYVPLLAISVIFNFIFGRRIQESHKKWILILGIIFNIAWLWYFKYNNFFLSSINEIAGTNWNLPSFIFPLGVSFYTFQQITYLMDCW